MNRKTAIGILILVLVVALVFVYVRGRQGEEQIAETPSGDVAGEAALVVTHSFGNGTHHYGGSVTVPTPCHSVLARATVAESFPEQVRIALTTVPPAEGTVCAQVLDRAAFDVSVAASENARLVSVTLGGEDIAFEVFEEGKG